MANPALSISEVTVIGSIGPGKKVGFPCGSAGKDSACNAGDLGLIPGLGRSPGDGKGYPLQYSGLENSMDSSPWGHKESDRTERLSLSKESRVSNKIRMIKNL